MTDKDAETIMASFRAITKTMKELSVALVAVNKKVDLLYKELEIIES